MGDVYGDYIGCECPTHLFREVTERLSDKVVAKVNDSQELAMINDFVRETNERTFKKSLEDSFSQIMYFLPNTGVSKTKVGIVCATFAQEFCREQWQKPIIEYITKTPRRAVAPRVRLSDISSWIWVLEDLSKRLEEAMKGLKYEHKACTVVLKRLHEEIQENSKSKPDVLCPKTDMVEKAIKDERRYLKDQKRTFNELATLLEDEMKRLHRISHRINKDISTKDQTLSIEETMANISLDNLTNIKKKNLKKPLSLEHWEDNCKCLKEEGLKALTRALICKQQVRGARVQLTVAAQAYANKVDVALRRRLHTNKAKVKEIEWQKSEAEKDLKALVIEQMNTEQSLVRNIEQEHVILARLADRTHRPDMELINDDVNYNLKIELDRVRRFVKDLRGNLEGIIRLQDRLKVTMTKMGCFVEDLETVIELDTERVNTRLGIPSSPFPNNQSQNKQDNLSSKSIDETLVDDLDQIRLSAGEQLETDENDHPNQRHSGDSVGQTAASTLNHPTILESIKEVDEDEEADDYPFPY